MFNCIYSGHCFEYTQCDKSCPVLAQTSYLLERNGIGMNNDVFKAKPELIEKYSNLLLKCKGSIRTVIEPNSTLFVANLLTYCGICQTWRGSQLHCVTYNLKFSQYLDALQKSWNNSGQPSDSDYMKIWADSAKILIISNIDYVNFKDFQCQTLLKILQSRDKPEFSTIIVSPTTQSLVGSGLFFSRVQEILSRTTVKS